MSTMTVTKSMAAAALTRSFSVSSFPGVSLIPMYCHALAARRLMKIPRSWSSSRTVRSRA